MSTVGHAVFIEKQDEMRIQGMISFMKCSSVINRKFYVRLCIPLILMFFSSWHILFHLKTFFQIGCVKCDKFFHIGCVGVSNFTCAMCTSLDQHLVNLEPDLRKDPPKVYFTK